MIYRLFLVAVIWAVSINPSIFAEQFQLKTSDATYTFDSETGELSSLSFPGRTVNAKGGISIFDDSHNGEPLNYVKNSFRQVGDALLWQLQSADKAVMATCSASVDNDVVKWKVQVHNENSPYVKLRIRCSLPFDFPSSWKWWNGRVVRNSSRFKSRECPGALQCTSHATLFGAVYDRKQGIVVGMNPDQNVSAYGPGLWKLSPDKFAVGYEIKVVVKGGTTLIRELFGAVFNDEFGIRSAVSKVWSAYPEAFRLTPAESLKLWGTGGGMVSKIVKPEKNSQAQAIPEAADLIRRFRMTWDWFYRGAPYSAAYKELAPYVAKKKIKWADIIKLYQVPLSNGKKPILPFPADDETTVIKTIDQLTADIDVRYADAKKYGVLGLYYVQPREQLRPMRELVFPDASYQGPSANILKDCHASLTGTSFGEFWKTYIVPQVMQNYPHIGGIALDSAIGNMFYTGPGVMNELDSAAYDDTGKLMVLDGAMLNVILKVWQKKEEEFGKLLPVIANANECMAPVLAPRVQGLLCEISPLNKNRSGTEIMRFNVGNKPITIWRGYEISPSFRILEKERNKAIEKWASMSGDQILDTLRDYARRVNAYCFWLGIFPSTHLMAGVPQLAEYTKILVPLSRDYGWQPVPAVKSSAHEKTIWLSRYGDTLGSAVVASDSKDERYATRLSIYSKYFKNLSKIVWADQFGNDLKQSITRNKTVFDTNIAGYCPQIFRAAAKIKCNSTVDATARLKLLPGQDSELTIKFMLPTKKQFIVGPWIPQGYTISDVQADGALVEKNGESDYKIVPQLQTVQLCVKYAPTCRLCGLDELEGFLSSLKSHGWKYRIVMSGDIAADNPAVQLFNDFATLQCTRGQNQSQRPDISLEHQKADGFYLVITTEDTADAHPTCTQNETAICTITSTSLGFAAKSSKDIEKVMRILLDYADRQMPFCGYVNKRYRLFEETGTQLQTEKGLLKKIIIWDDPHFPYVEAK